MCVKKFLITHLIMIIYPKLLQNWPWIRYTAIPVCSTHFYLLLRCYQYVFVRKRSLRPFLLRLSLVPIITTLFQNTVFFCSVEIDPVHITGVNSGRMVALFRFIQVKTVHACIWLTIDGFITDLFPQTILIIQPNLLSFTRMIIH